MPYLDNIIGGLNNNWISSSLKFIAPHEIMPFGISEMIVDVGTDTDGKPIVERYPAVIDNSGDAKMIVPDDSYSIIMYHKLEGIVNGVVQRSGFGDSLGDQLETVNMALVVFAFRKKVKKPAHFIEAVLKDGLPDQSKMTDNENNFLQSSVFRPGSSSFDKVAILSRDYSDIEINPDIVLFEMKYRIENTWRKGCLEKCNC